MEIKNNEIKIEHKTKKLEEVNVIKVSRGYVYLSSNLVDCVQSDINLDEIEQRLNNVGIDHFHRADNMLINIANIKSMFIRSYQYAGISIFQCAREHSDLNIVNLVCKNGKNESIPFSTFKEAEAFYHEIDALIANYKNQEVVKNLTSSC